MAGPTTEWPSLFIRAVIVSLALSALLTSIICLWEWWENPGGIFHHNGVTRWDRLAETAISWFVPGFGYLLGPSMLGLWCHRRLKYR